MVVVRGKREKHLDIFTQLVVVIGRLQPEAVQMLGTGFIVSNDGKIATTRHVCGSKDDSLVILIPNMKRIDEYQDLSNNKCQIAPCKIIEADPMRDLAILKADISLGGVLPPIGSVDNTSIGEPIGIFGFPHCVHGRRALTYQQAEIGAKVLLDSNGIKSKHAVINVQARPGQSGSLIFSPRLQCITGVLMGAWIPGGGSSMSLGGIDPHELHQTTHCISAEYIRKMI